MWFWNGPLDADKTRKMLQDSKAASYGGVGILPSPNMTPAFMIPEYLDQYKAAVEEAAKLGMKCCLYDEYWFPSGSAGGLLAQKYPEALSKRLDMLESDVTGPMEVSIGVPAGTLMGVVAMEMGTYKRINITSSVKNGQMSWSAPAGKWKIMIFTCVRDGGAGLVDYLSPEAVSKFIKLTYQAYYDRFPSHFGTTIESAFYDEPALYHVQGGRAWTDKFNEKFRQANHYDPIPLYPALWYDIGPETASARHALFDFRTELYSKGFIKTIEDWCHAHHIQLTGHVDQEELVNPVIGQCGDLMKAFELQDIPGIDEIGFYGRASRAYKIVSSAACNFGRPHVMTECYGAMDNMPQSVLYKEAMDLFAKGINTMVPHAVWYDPAKIVFQPDLSPGSEKYGSELPAFNQYIGRLERMLQNGRHVSDIGVLYPIATLQAGSAFGPGDPYQGITTPKEADYMDVGEALSLQIRRDFLYVHPETLESKCKVIGNEIRLKNEVCDERFKVFILPGSRAIAWSALRKIKNFYDHGGRVISTTLLPDKSVEPGRDADVKKAIAEMFAPEALIKAEYPKVTASSSWKTGEYDAAMTIDGDVGTRWNAADNEKDKPQWLEIDFGAKRTFRKTIIKEQFDRTCTYRIQYWNGDTWIDCAKGNGLFPEKADTFGPVTGTRIRLCIDSVASDSASIREFEVFDLAGRNIALSEPAIRVRTNGAGGQSWFISSPRASVLLTILDEALPSADVRFEDNPVIKDGNLSYIHKVNDGRDVYFFANSSDTEVDTNVVLRGQLNLEAWDPHTGAIFPVDCSLLDINGLKSTRVHLRFGAVRSVFLVSKTSNN